MQQRLEACTVTVLQVVSSRTAGVSQVGLLVAQLDKHCGRLLLVC